MLFQQYHKIIFQKKKTQKIRIKINRIFSIIKKVITYDRNVFAF